MSQEFRQIVLNFLRFFHIAPSMCFGFINLEKGLSRQIWGNVAHYLGLLLLPSVVQLNNCFNPIKVFSFVGPKMISS